MTANAIVDVKIHPARNVCFIARFNERDVAMSILIRMVDFGEAFASPWVGSCAQFAQRRVTTSGTKCAAAIRLRRTHPGVLSGLTNPDRLGDVGRRRTRIDVADS